LNAIGTFNDFFTVSLVERAVRNNIAYSTSCPPSHDNYGQRLFVSATLQRRITLGKDKHPLIKSLTTLVDSLVEREWPSSDKAADELRWQYTKHVCNALRAVPYDELFFPMESKLWCSSPTSVQAVIVAACAAVGNVQMFLNNAHSIKDVLEAGDEAFPNALEAAVAANQTAMVEVILKWLLATVKGPWETGTWNEMRSVSRGLLNALRVAVRTSRDTIAHTILEIFRKQKVLAESVRWSQLKELYEDCVKYGDTTFFPMALSWKEYKELPKSSDPDSITKICTDDLPYIVQRALPRLLRNLIGSGRVDVKFVEAKLDIWLIPESRRYKRVKALLKERTNIDAVAPNETLSTYGLL
jgi:hypothetical protein